MTAGRQVGWASCAALALVLVGCGSIVPLDGADGGEPPPSKSIDAGPASRATDAGGGTAQGCAGKDDCSNGLVCDVTTGSCVECLVNADCPGKTKLCDLAKLTCLACPSDDGACGGDKN
ncbi:MAG TPA: hypothetical protein VKZ18_00250 [Polyangia bacterium]|nr:hypothetical protein [Polyangia bacterium]